MHIGISSLVLDEGNVFAPPTLPNKSQGPHYPEPTVILHWGGHYSAQLNIICMADYTMYTVSSDNNALGMHKIITWGTRPTEKLRKQMTSRTARLLGHIACSRTQICCYLCIARHIYFTEK